jgi:hypothetical protein
MALLTREQLHAETATLAGEVAALSARYRRAKARYAAQQTILRRRYPDRGDFLAECRTNTALAQAASDCAWYGTDLERCAAALTALTLAGREGT